MEVDVTPLPLIPDDAKPAKKEESKEQTESKTGDKKESSEVTESRGVTDPMISFSMRSVEQSESLSEFSDDVAKEEPEK
jgi:hypothetical protein